MKRNSGTQRHRRSSPATASNVEPVVAAEESLLFALPTEIRRDLKARGLSDQMRHDASFAESGSPR